MPRKKNATAVSAPMTVQSIPPTVETPKKNRRVKVLAKMLLKEVRGPKSENSRTFYHTPAKYDRQKQQISVNNPAQTVNVVSETSSAKKPRKPPTEKMLDWRKTFAEVRKRHPGRRTPEFDAALRQASTAYKQRWSNRVN